MVSSAFLAEMDRQQGITPRTKVEFIDKSNNVTDVSAYYLSGANFEQVRQRAVTEIQAGQMTIVMSNQDDKFSEFVVGSLLYGLDYVGAKIRVSEGFLLPNGTLEYAPQCTMYIDELATDPKVSQVTFSCRDSIGFIMDKKIHAKPPKEIAVADPGNVGNGILSSVDTLPFVTVNDDWTITCTTPGADGVAQFSVVGVIAGSIGPATSGSVFTSTSKGLRFTIHAGSTIWSTGDKFTFSLSQHPQYTNVNAAKVLWSLLTGYSWDSNTQETFHSLTFAFDHTQSDANVDIDYLAFATLVSLIDNIGVYSLTGYIPYDKDAVQAIQELIIMFLGTIYSGKDGRILVTTYIPPVTPNFRTFADTAKITDLDYYRLIDEVINSVTVNYIASQQWAWSSDSQKLDGSYSVNDATSVTNRGVYSESYTVPWYAAGGNHVQDFASKLIARFKDPPLEIELITGLDGLLTRMGDRVIINDTKSGFVGVIGEVTRTVLDFDQQPASITFRVRQDATTNTIFGVIGSTANEGDGQSPQSDNYDTATTADKQFAYFSKVGSSAAPQYFVF